MFKIMQQGELAYKNTEVHLGTPKYSLVSSESITTTLNRYGWSLTGVSQRSKRLTAKHIMVYESSLKTDEGTPRILVFNSHDKSCAVTIQFGFFRAVCANGLVVGTSIIEPIRIRHIGDMGDKLDQAIAEFISKITIVMGSIDKMKDTVVSYDRIATFLDEAKKLRKTTGINVDELNSSTRVDDMPNNVWSIMNRVQEKMVNGGGGYRRLRSDVSKARISSDLWDLAHKHLMAA
jgi:hypothetical protein